MRRSGKNVATILAAVSLLALAAPPVRAADEESPTLTVRVIDAASKDPIFQARLTLEFVIPGGFMKKSQTISYSAKTDKKGEYKFTTVPQGKIRLFVTAPDHEAFGRSFKFTKDHQTISVKLRKPQPVL